jgi:hypothetical protein
MFTPDDAQDKPQLEVFPESADNLHLDYRVYEVREAGDIDAVFARLVPDKAHCRENCSSRSSDHVDDP